MRALEDDRKVPIIAVTTRKQNLDLERFRQVGADAFLLKPFNSNQFLQLIDNVHQKYYDSSTTHDMLVIDDQDQETKPVATDNKTGHDQCF